MTTLLFHLLLCFRTFLITTTTDIKKPILQESVDKSDGDYLRFLWLDGVFSEAPIIFRNSFAFVVFDVTRAPFFPNGTIRKHIQNYNFDQDFVRKVLESFCVDCFSGGEKTIETAFELF